MLQKRVDAILKIGPNKPSVSTPVLFAKKKWVSPLERRNSNDEFQPYHEVCKQSEVGKQWHNEEVKRVVKILDINKQLKYFGEYLQV